MDSLSPSLGGGVSAEKEAEMRQNRRKKSEEGIWTGGDLSNPLAGPTVRKEGQTKKGKIAPIPLLLPFSVKKRGQKKRGNNIRRSGRRSLFFCGPRN